MARIRELDGLRFFAIVGVLAVHYRPPYRPALDFLGQGWVGVDLFFVISGFLITSNLLALRNATHPFRDFYWRRTLRIFPPYYLVLFILCGLLLYQHQNILTHSTLAAFTFLSSFLTHPSRATLIAILHGRLLDSQPILLDNHVLTSYTDGLGIFWSLSIEELFYLMWAPIILKFSQKQIWTISLLVIAVCALLRIVVHSSAYPEGFFFPCRVDALMAGCILALLLASLTAGKIARPTLLKGLMATAVLSFTGLASLSLHDGLLRHVELRSTLSFAAFGYPLLALFFSSCVGLCSLCAGSSLLWVRFLRSKPLVFIGTISYMMYLIHIPVWISLHSIQSSWMGYAPPPTLTLGLVACSVTIAIATISWRFFEKPILKFKDAKFATPRESQLSSK